MDQHAGLAGRGCEVQRDGTPRRWENVLTLALSVARANQHARRRLTTALVWALTGAGYHPEPNPPPTGSRQPQVTVLLNTTITVDVDVANKPTVDAEGPHQALPASLPAGQSVGPPGLCVACPRAGSQRARRATGRRCPWPPTEHALIFLLALNGSRTACVAAQPLAWPSRRTGTDEIALPPPVACLSRVGQIGLPAVTFRHIIDTRGRVAPSGRRGDTRALSGASVVGARCLGLAVRRGSARWVWHLGWLAWCCRRRVRRPARRLRRLRLGRVLIGGSTCMIRSTVR